MVPDTQTEAVLVLAAALTCPLKDCDQPQCRAAGVLRAVVAERDEAVRQRETAASELRQATSDFSLAMESAGHAVEAAEARAVTAEALIQAVQSHARECGWQDVDDPLAALLAWQG